MLHLGRYNESVEIRKLHNWQMTVAEAQALQSRLAGQVMTRNELKACRFLAGVDLSPPNSQGLARGAVVVCRYPELTIVEKRTAQVKLTFPYVPGLLSFRESPAILAALEKVTAPVDLLMVDGQGLAHPRRFGIACHLGLLTDLPTIGCAKSRLWGQHGPPGAEAGCHVPLLEGKEVLGAVLVTKAQSNPLYVSIGHKVDLETALYWVQACCRGYRLPEPTRLAHLAAAGQLGPDQEYVRESPPQVAAQPRLL